MPKIERLEFDEGNISEMAPHGVKPRDVNQVFRNKPGFIPNTKKHPRQPKIMVGQTNGGRWLSVPIGPTDTPGVWRPATAYDAEPDEIRRAAGGKRP